MNASISVVIPVHNGARFIREALNSVYSQTQALQEIIVVDDASTDETIAIIEECYPQTTIIRNESNLGFGKTCNRGIQHALDREAEFVCLANQDLILDKECLARLAEALRANPAYGMTGAFQLTYDGHSIDPGFHKWAPREMWSDLFLGRPQTMYETRFIPAATVLIRQEALFRVGGFDPLFHMYGEDDDFCERMHSAAWKIGLVPQAVGRHWNGGIQAKRTFKWHVNYEYSRAVLYLKRAPVPFPVAFLTLWWWWGKSQSFRQSLARVRAYMSCCRRSVEIGRHRRSIPFNFTHLSDVTNVGMNDGTSATTGSQAAIGSEGAHQVLQRSERISLW